MLHRIAVLVIISFVCLSGCGKKKDFTQEDFLSIKAGASQDEVKEKLGTPDRTETLAAGAMNWHWKREKVNYMLMFNKEGKVMKSSIKKTED